MKILCVAGARPNFMKVAPLLEAFRSHPGLVARLVHTGQHYDERMSDLFFRELGIPAPDVNLGVGGGSHAVQTAEIMKAFEPVCEGEKPDAVLVVGDVNSTIACSLVAAKLGVRVVHVEAGLRSGDRSMPEEINRVLTDAISDLLFCTEPAGVENLRREGVAAARIHLVGNVMIDTLVRHLEKARRSMALQNLGLVPGGYATMTLHRPSNVDNAEVFSGLLEAIEKIQADLPVVFPIHPRTRNNLERLGLAGRVSRMRNLRLVEPLGYLDFLHLNSQARLVITDSGGLQEETTFLQIPCITLRENTERPITCEVGTNQLAGLAPEAILAAYRRIVDGKLRPGRIPELWDGHAAERIAALLAAQPWG